MPAEGPIIFFVYYILPYITIIVFFSGLVYRLAYWLKKSPPKASLTLFPKPHSSTTAPSLVLDEIGFPRLARFNKLLWVLAILLHISLIPLFFGHLRIFQEPVWLWSLMNLTDEGVKSFAFYAGGITGVIFMFALSALLVRRSKSIMRIISVLEDYFILILLIAIAITGNYMRLAMHINVTEIQTYFTSLTALNPTITPTVFEPNFTIHFLLVESFLIYFPFSKLIHVIGSFFVNYIVKR